jgi:nucleotide-binding universal stress UspA family protein
MPQSPQHAALVGAPPVAFTQVVVPLDGSEQSARAIPVAHQLGERFGADLACVAIATPESDPVQLRHDVELATTSPDANDMVVVVEGDHVPEGILATVDQQPGCLLCMGSHGRGRAAGLVGSVASAVATRAADPLVLVGPRASEDHRLAGALVACVDGSPWSESVLPIAVGWAAALQLDLSIVTVAEPMPEPVRPGVPYHRRHGPPAPAEEYIDRLVTAWRGRGVAVDGEAVYDPVSVIDGLTDYLQRRPAALVAATTHARTGVARLMLGSVAASIVHNVPAPVLLVPAPS